MIGLVKAVIGVGGRGGGEIVAVRGLKAVGEGGDDGCEGVEGCGSGGRWWL